MTVPRLSFRHFVNFTAGIRRTLCDGSRAHEVPSLTKNYTKRIITPFCYVIIQREYVQYRTFVAKDPGPLQGVESREDTGVETIRKQEIIIKIKHMVR